MHAANQFKCFETIVFYRDFKKDASFLIPGGYVFEPDQSNGLLLVHPDVFAAINI